MLASPPAQLVMGGYSLLRGMRLRVAAFSMKGIDIVVHGNIGHMSAFMAQAGNLVVLGDAGEALGDSIYEASTIRTRQH